MREPRFEVAHVRTLFLRLLGAIFVAAFASLFVQVTVLVGREGLLPAEAFLAATRRAGGGVLGTPTLFWLDASDATLRGAAAAGIALGLALTASLAPRWTLAALWALYLSFVTIGQDFLSFQWDNLLLETALMALLVTPGGLRPRRAPPPHPIAVFLMRWLVFRLNFESGAAKLLGGDPTWRSLAAMIDYYETAPLPTWLGWWAHQLPTAVHTLTAGATLAIELGVAFLVFGSRRLRVATCVVFVLLQLIILLTANYGFFNHLSLFLCLWLLDDGHLTWLAARAGRTLPAVPRRRARPLPTALLAVTAAALVVLSIVAFLPWVGVPPALAHPLRPVQQALRTVRSVNAYHLFARMTLVRNEVVIEGTADGSTWLAYEFRYKPGDPMRPPPFVAPHQPRVDFQLWFLLLGGGRSAPYFTTLLERLLTAPHTVAPLFADAPFGETPPTALRLTVYRYQFTDLATRRRTGTWWERTPLSMSAPLTATSLRR